MFARAIVCFLLGVGSTIHATAQVRVLTHHNDNARTGANLGETILNVSNVNAAQFGMLFSLPIDAQVYAQPLYMPNVNIPGKGTHNVVYVATENNSVYAFDADAAGPPLWRENFGTAHNCNCDSGNIYPLVGITATPVIDPNTGTMYVANLVFDPVTKYHRHFLHALDISTGAEKFGGPVRILGSVPGTADGGTTVNFSDVHQHLRTALTLVNNVVLFGTASYEDWQPFHGWVFAYDAKTLKQVAVWNSTPNGQMGSVWQSGGGFVTDDSNNIYFITGNGDFDGISSFGMSFVKLGLAANAFTVLDYFSPQNEATLSSVDSDLGAAGPMRIPGTNYLLGGGKEGKLYLLDMTNLGKFELGADQVLQEFQVSDGPGGGQAIIRCVPAYYVGPAGQLIYLWPSGDHLKAFQFQSGQLQTAPFSQGDAIAPVIGPVGQPGGFLSISANGNLAGTGIVWANTPYDGDADGVTVPGILYAYDASNLSNELWDSKQNAARDDFGNFAKFVAPTVANGKVYMATFSNQVAVYGLMPFSLKIAQSSQSVVAGGSATFSVDVNALLNNFTGAVSLSVPAGTTASFSPATISASGSSTLTVTTTSQTPPGTYPIVITATSGTFVQKATVQLTVAGFTISASPQTQTVVAGTNTSYNLSIGAQSGFTGIVSLSVPPGTSASFSPTTITGSGNSALAVTVASQTPTGNYPIVVTATSGTLVQTATVQLDVTGFGISVSPQTQTVVAGSAISYTVTVNALNGFNGTVSLDVPDGTSASLSPAQIVGSGTAVLTVTTTSQTPPNTYPLLITATSGNLVQTATVDVIVTASGT